MLPSHTLAAAIQTHLQAAVRARPAATAARNQGCRLLSMHLSLILKRAAVRPHRETTTILQRREEKASACIVRQARDSGTAARAAKAT